MAGATPGPCRCELNPYISLKLPVAQGKGQKVQIMSKTNVSKTKNMSRAEAFAPNRELPNRLVLKPLRIPHVALSAAQDPTQWHEVPVQDNLFGGIIPGAAIKFPILGREHAFVGDYSEPDLLLMTKVIFYLSMHAYVRVFYDLNYQLYLCSNADDATIQAAMCYAGKEVFGSHTPYRTTNTTPQGKVRMSGNIPE